MVKPTQPIPHGRAVSGVNRWPRQPQGPTQGPPGLSQVEEEEEEEEEEVVEVVVVVVVGRERPTHDLATEEREKRTV